MARHYSQPKGCVGRSIAYIITYNNVEYGGIIGGSALMNLGPRDKFFGLSNNYKEAKNAYVQRIINNTFYHIEKINNEYPIREFAVKVLKEFRKQVVIDWTNKYLRPPIGFETLVELPRTGEIYRRDGWIRMDEPTKGYTCKREADIDNEGTDSWTGKRVWNTNEKELRPKWIFCRKV